MSEEKSLECPSGRVSTSDELEALSARIRKACNGHPHAKIPWPHRLLHEAADEIDRLNALINTPITDDWLWGVKLEAAHQQHRWGAEHDAGKAPADWFWLLGYLAGKALSSAMVGNIDKAKHHTISSGAALLNWWRALDGDPAAKMRPGIDPPASTAQTSQPDTK